MRLAFTTILVLKHPYSHPDIISYGDRVGPVYSAAENSPGFIDRARPIDPDETKSSFEWDFGVWGAFTTPRFYTGSRVSATDTRASTLTVWTDVESVRNFMRSEAHRYMVRNQTKWVAPMGWMNNAAWWIGDDEIPTWSEAARRIELLNDKGPSPEAFNLRTSYDQFGRLTRAPRTAHPHALEGTSAEWA
jgi:hypothetical protein